MSYETLLDASFKGVPFYVIAEELTRFGRRLVKHEYPNTSEQYVEDVGGFPADFSVSGFVIGSDAQDKFNALRNALNEQGAGLLVLPFFGEKTVLAGECSVTVEPYVNVERIAFTMEYCDSRGLAGLADATANADSVTDLGDDLRDITGSAFAEYYESGDPLFGETELADLKAVLASVRGFQNNLKKYIAGTELGQILKQIDLVSDGLASIINTGRGLVDQFTSPDGIYQLLSNVFIGNGTGSLISAIGRESRNFKKRLSINPNVIRKQKTNPNFDFEPQTVNFWPDDTADRIKRNELRQNLIDFYKVNLLGIGYQVLADTVFQTEDEADGARAELEAAYIEMMHGIDDIKDGEPIKDAAITRSPFLSDQRVSTAFERVRVAALQAAEDRELVLYKVESATVTDFFGMSCLNLAYLTQAEQISSEQDLIDMTAVMYQINNRQAYAIKGNIKVLRRIEL